MKLYECQYQHTQLLTVAVACSFEMGSKLENSIMFTPIKGDFLKKKIHYMHVLLHI